MSAASRDDGASKLLSLGLLAALLCGCPGSDPEPEPEPEPEKAWQIALDHEDLDRAVLSVWGTAANKVFAVGGPLGNSGFESLALYFDGSSWRDLAPGGEASFWWVAGTSGTDVWMVGEKGRITHFDGSELTEHDSGVEATIWGVWPFSAKDVWAVGGTPLGGTAEPNDIVLHYDGDSWKPVTLPGEPLGVAHYKVWGTSSDNLYVVGEQGTIWHRSGSGWVLQSDPPIVSSTLFTVHGCSAEQVYAVGGLSALRSGGDGTWTKESLKPSNAINGVSCADPDQVIVVGGGGQKQRLIDGVWTNEYDIPPFVDLHAAWAAADGTFWVVGGDFLSGVSPNQPRDGMVARYGSGALPDVITP